MEKKITKQSKQEKATDSKSHYSTKNHIQVFMTSNFQFVAVYIWQVCDFKVWTFT